SGQERIFLPTAHCALPTFLLQRPLERLPDVRLEDVADLDVVVAGELDAAFEAGLDLADVVLEALEGLDRQVLGDDHPAAGEADLAAALDVPVGDVAASSTSLSVMPPTAAWITRIRTSSVL